MISANVNEIFALRGKVDALSAKEKLLKEVILGGSLASIAPDISKLGKHLNLQCITHPNAESFYELPQFGGRIFLLCIQCSTRLDHTIGVDTRWNLILDSSERYPLVLSSKSLLLCAGRDSMKLRIADVGEIATNRMLVSKTIN